MQRPQLLTWTKRTSSQSPSDSALYNSSGIAWLPFSFHWASSQPGRTTDMKCPGVLTWAKEQCTKKMPAKSVRSLYVWVSVSHDCEDREATGGYERGSAEARLPVHACKQKCVEVCACEVHSKREALTVPGMPGRANMPMCTARVDTF